MVRVPAGFTSPLGDGEGPWIYPTPGGWSGPLDSPHPRGMVRAPLDSPQPRRTVRVLLDSPHPQGMVRAPGFTLIPRGSQGPLDSPHPWWMVRVPLDSPHPQGTVRVLQDSPHPQGMVRSPWIPLTPGDGQGPPAFLSGTDHHGCFLLLSCRFSKKGRAGVVRVSPRQAGLGALWLEVEVSWLRRAACDHVHMHGVTSPGEA